MASNKFIFHQQNYCQDKSTLLILADSKSLFASHLEIWHYYSLGIIAVTYLMSPSTSISMLKYSILRIHLASKCAMFGLTLPKLFSKLICMTSFPWYWLKPQTAEKFYLTFLFMMNHIKSLIWIWQTRLNFTSVQWFYHLPRYKTFLKYGCWLLSFQYCYIKSRLWVWIQLDEYLSFSWHNMSSFGN